MDYHFTFKKKKMGINIVIILKEGQIKRHLHIFQG